MNQTKFEKILVDMVTKGNGPGLERLREQFEKSSIKSRENTGVGFYVYYEVDRESVKPFVRDIKFGDLLIKGDGLEDGAGIVIHTESGYLDMLECYAYGDEWPDSYENIEISYSAEPRDLKDIDEAV